MKINNKILNIPPYISTAWSNIESLYVNSEKALVIILKGNEKIEIPNLDQNILTEVFNSHSKFSDHPETSIDDPKNKIGVGFPVKMGLESIELLGNAMQHNPEKANAPDLPEEVIKKITSISKVIGMEVNDAMPQAEPHCNCVHCQIARALSGVSKKENLEFDPEEEVSTDDLKFREWDILQKSENLYLVTNPLDAKESYNVFLGNPIGCTCGHKNCEHLRAVLNS